jgi:predicted RecB family nuclease
MRHRKYKEESMDNTMQSLRIIPGVGPKLTQKFFDIGITRISDLKGKNPEELYSHICTKQGTQVDRCVLYVCRSSVYFAETEKPDPEKLKWWYWKDKN